MMKDLFFKVSSYFVFMDPAVMSFNFFVLNSDTFTFSTLSEGVDPESLCTQLNFISKLHLAEI